MGVTEFRTKLNEIAEDGPVVVLRGNRPSLFVIPLDDDERDSELSAQFVADMKALRSLRTPQMVEDDVAELRAWHEADETVGELVERLGL